MLGVVAGRNGEKRLGREARGIPKAAPQRIELLKKGGGEGGGEGGE